MKNSIIIALSLAAAFSAAAVDKDLAKWDPNMANSTARVDTDGVKWIDGKLMPIEGRWTLGDAANYYSRLPDTLTTNVNAGVRGMRTNTAGMQFRFKTDSKFIMVRYRSLSGKYEGSINQTGVNIHGWDFYRYNKQLGKWVFAAASHTSSVDPKNGEYRIKKLYCNPGDECLINLPAYDGISEIEFGIAKNAKIMALPKRKSGVDKPVVFYGTSITHGASASRPGLGFVSIIGRDLDVPVYNLGFSGSGVMEYELSDVIARIDASCYVLDCLWNMVNADKPDKRPGKGGRSVEANYEPFIRNLRAKRPDVPIIMAEQCDVYMNGPNNKDRFMKKLYEQLIKEGWKNLYYLPKDKMYTGDCEGTVEGCHPNDLGMVSLAKAYGEAVKTALKLK